TFSKNVNNVAITDFELSYVGSVTATLSSLTGSNDTYDINVSNISGEGSLKLNLKAGTNITTVSGGISGTPGYTGGQAHYVTSCFIEKFDQGETNGSHTFSGNGKTFSLSTNWTVNTE